MHHGDTEGTEGEGGGKSREEGRKALGKEEEAGKGQEERVRR